MARIIVTADPDADHGARAPRGESQVLLDERITSLHLQDGHAAGQLVERLTWAVTDAEQAERGHAALAG